MWSQALLLILHASLLLSGHFDHLDNAFVQDDTLVKRINLTSSRPTGVTPGLAIAVEYNEVEEDDPEPSENIGEDYTYHHNHKMGLDPFTLHHPMHSSNIVQFEFSDWYFLFFKPVNKSSPKLTDVSSATSEVTTALSSKLSVPSSMFSINSLDKYKSNSISANLSLVSHSIPKLHQKLCHLQNTSPIFWIRGSQFRLVQVFHDKNQHLYINNKQSSTNPMDSLGLLITLILGGLGMFLLVLAITFVAAKTITKQDFERFNDMEDIIVDPEEFLDEAEYSKDIFIIDDGENANHIEQSAKNAVLTRAMKDRKVSNSSNFFSTLSKSSRNLFGKKRLINVSE